MGLLITNGEFVCIPGERIQVVVEPTCTGSVRLVNCAFWVRPANAWRCTAKAIFRFRIATSRSPAECPPENPIRSRSWKADSGRLQVRGCTLRSRGKEPNILLKKGLKHAISARTTAPSG